MWRAEGYTSARLWACSALPTIPVGELGGRLMEHEPLFSEDELVQTAVEAFWALVDEDPRIIHTRETPLGLEES